MPPRPAEPTAAEWRILSVVSQRGPSSAAEILEQLRGDTDWSASTVKTLLRRLVDKGYLRVRTVGNSFLYSAGRSPLAALRRAGEELLDRASDAAVGPLLFHLLKRSRLSQRDIDELRALIDQKRDDDEAAAP